MGTLTFFLRKVMDGEQMQPDSDSEPERAENDSESNQELSSDSEPAYVPVKVVKKKPTKKRRKKKKIESKEQSVRICSLLKK